MDIDPEYFMICQYQAWDFVTCCWVDSLTIWGHELRHVTQMIFYSKKVVNRNSTNGEEEKGRVTILSRLTMGG